MYVHSVVLTNIRSIAHFNFELEPKEFAGWHVLLGDNGSGKSSFIRSVAAALIGPTQIAALRQDWSLWLRNGADSGSFSVALDRDEGVDAITGGGMRAIKYYITAGFHLRREEVGTRPSVIAKAIDSKPDPLRYVWGSGAGWFSAAYGPFRRFAGGNQEYAKLFYSHPRLAAHLSAFGEDIALTECLEWIMSLKFRELERKKEGLLLGELIRFVNQSGLLPQDAAITDVSSDGIRVSDGFGTEVSVLDLSDGYRSVLSMTFELIRQLTVAYENYNVFTEIDGKLVVNLPGVVLIDEVDVHLHPTWQRRIGNWFTSVFPKMQFIVTTHSPLVCQAAVRGSIWRLPSFCDSREMAGRVVGDDLARLLYGDIATAHATQLFGLDQTRSGESLDLIKELAMLNAKELDVGLDSKDLERVRRLRNIFGSLPGSEDSK